MPHAELRLNGFCEAAAALGIEPWVMRMTGDYTEEAGAEGCSGELLAAGAMLPTAAVASNDQSAFGFMQVMLRARIPVPEEMSVTGFDDSRLAQLSCVDLTTARQDPAAMGEAAVVAAIRRIERGTARPSELVITPTLVVRGSTSQPRTTSDPATA